MSSPIVGGLSTGGVFNRTGTRLLYEEVNQPLRVFDVPAGGEINSATEKVHLKDPEFSSPFYGGSNMCFAGQEEDLVIAASEGHGRDYRLHVWSLPESAGGEAGGDVTIDQSITILRGNTSPVFSVRYDHSNDVLASGGFEKMIKLWSPVAQ